MIPEQENHIQTDELEADFSSAAFYDTVPFVNKSTPANDARVVSAVHYLHNYTIPVHDSFTVRIKPTAVIPFDSNKVVVQLVSNHKVEAVKGAWKNGWMEARFRDLGIVKLIEDKVPPRITATGFINGGSVSNRKLISFVVTDDTGEINRFEALEDGKWLLFSRKNNAYIHTFDERHPGENMNSLSGLKTWQEMLRKKSSASPGREMETRMTRIEGFSQVF